MSDIPTMQAVEIGRIFLDLENPRHELYENEAQVIDYLCRYENIFPLAKDIVQNGLNPLELLAIIPDEGSGSGKERKPSFTVAEGNRRLCALKLLDDPERSPAKMRKSFSDLGEGWPGVGELTCMVFSDRDAVRLWLSRIHEGEQGGIGRKKWNSDQTARHSGGSKNKLALAVLDYAESEGLITTEGRKGRLTTVQRYLNNPLVREAIGIDGSNVNDISRNRSKPNFDMLLRKFLDDLGTGSVNSRANKDQHTAYARELGAMRGQTHERTEPTSLTPSARTSFETDPKKSRPKKRKPPRYVSYDTDVMDALEGLGGDKLPNLYSSICSVALDAHTPLVAIGAWAFLESLTAKAGRNVGTDFPSFFSKQRLKDYGLPTGKGDKAIMEALRRVSTSGDVTKHDGGAAFFNGEQLVNDMETLKKLIIGCAAEAVS
ncbi:hypothetical protein [Sphingomonas sp. CFBP 13720]|uniref:hypothetical protein n=1 Tax=Sphingomonas sp. CFBP 13720 TaxID=2775302 RepID=UPI0017807C32|nr:hypothetical protein [Sphingomonas sp. CFBP 13720]MBD8677912.1 hypothetical protein [Sphingomonas sp. CFBP 13720]